MPKRLLFTVDDETFRRFRHLAIDHGVTNAQLLAKLLDAHQQLLEWQHRPAPNGQTLSWADVKRDGLTIGPVTPIHLDHVIRPVDALTMPSTPSEPPSEHIERPDDLVEAMLTQVEGDAR